MGLWGFLKKTICVRTVGCSHRTGITTVGNNLEKGSILRVHLGDEAVCMTISWSNEMKNVGARCIEQPQHWASIA